MTGHAHLSIQKTKKYKKYAGVAYKYRYTPGGPSSPYGPLPIGDPPSDVYQSVLQQAGDQPGLIGRGPARCSRLIDIFSGMGNPPGCRLRSPGAALPETQAAGFIPPVQPPSHYCGSCPQKNPRRYGRGQVPVCDRYGGKTRATTAAPGGGTG